MPTPEQYDAIIIGSGEAGKFMAWHLGSHGSRVIAIEKDAIGGACPNVACLPSKNVVHSAKVAFYFQRGAEFGMVHDEWHVDMATVRAHKRKMVEGLAEVHLNNFKKSGAEFAMGFGKFIGPKTVQVDLNAGGTRTLTADKIFIDTGSRATIEPIPGLLEAHPLTHIEALELDVVPNVTISKVEGLSGASVKLHLSNGTILPGSHILVAAGRTPNTQNMG